MYRRLTWWIPLVLMTFSGCGGGSGGPSFTPDSDLGEWIGTWQFIGRDNSAKTGTAAVTLAVNHTVDGSFTDSQSQTIYLLTIRRDVVNGGAYLVTIQPQDQSVQGQLISSNDFRLGFLTPGPGAPEHFVIQFDFYGQGSYAGEYRFDFTERPPAP